MSDETNDKVFSRRREERDIDLPLLILLGAWDRCRAEVTPKMLCDHRAAQRKSILRMKECCWACGLGKENLVITLINSNAASIAEYDI